MGLRGVPLLTAPILATCVALKNRCLVSIPLFFIREYHKDNKKSDSENFLKKCLSVQYNILLL